MQGLREVEDKVGNLRNSAQSCRALRMWATETRDLRSLARTFRDLRASQTDKDLGDTKRTWRVSRITKMPRGPWWGTRGEHREELVEEHKGATRRDSKMLQKVAPLLLLPQPGQHENSL